MNSIFRTFKHNNNNNDNNNYNNNLLLIECYLQTQINSALQSKMLIITSLILITDIKMSTNTNTMIYNTMLVGYIKLIEFLQVQWCICIVLMQE